MEKAIQNGDAEIIPPISHALRLDTATELSSLESTQLIQQLKWHNHRNGSLSYVQGRQYERLKERLPGVNFRQGSLREQALSDWLERKVSNHDTCWVTC